MEYFPRKLQNRIMPWLDKPDIIVIQGPRQAGKTSLLALLRNDLENRWGEQKNVISFNLEDRDHLDALNRDPKFFKEFIAFHGADLKKETIVMIDEVQYMHDPSHFLKYIADFEPSIKLIVTGSTSLRIKRFKDGITGRKKTFTLYPLDFEEFLLFKGKEKLSPVIEKFNFRSLDLKTKELNAERIKPFEKEIGILYEEYILFGGYPKAVLAKSKEEKLEELKELFETYELKDINILFDVANISSFRNFFRLLAGSVGHLFNANEISNTLGIGRDTVKRYLSILENSFIAHALPPFHSNIRKEITKMPKIFFLDTGLRNFALRNFTELTFRPDKGSLFENTIFTQLYKNLNITDQLFFWRTISKTEVDFILTGERKWAFEVKLTQDSRLTPPPGLNAFFKLYPDFSNVVVTLNRFVRGKGVSYLRGWMI